MMMTAVESWIVDELLFQKAVLFFSSSISQPIVCVSSKGAVHALLQLLRFILRFLIAE